MLDAGGARADAAAAPVPVLLATECGPTDTADMVTPTTVSYAVRKVARAVFGIPGTEAGPALRVHVRDGAKASGSLAVTIKTLCWQRPGLWTGRCWGSRLAGGAGFGGRSSSKSSLPGVAATPGCHGRAEAGQCQQLFFVFF